MQGSTIFLKGRCETGRKIYWEKQIHCLELCFIPLEMTVLYFYVNNSTVWNLQGGEKRILINEVEIPYCVFVSTVYTIACSGSKSKCVSTRRATCSFGASSSSLSHLPFNTYWKITPFHEGSGIAAAQRQPLQL